MGALSYYFDITFKSVMCRQVEAQEYISSCNCPDYLQRAEARLREESERVQNYLDSISEPKITSVVETELILHQVPLPL